MSDKEPTPRKEFEKHWQSLNWYSRFVLNGPEKERYWSWFEAGWEAHRECGEGGDQP